MSPLYKQFQHAPLLNVVIITQTTEYKRAIKTTLNIFTEEKKD
jgi:hypothetical protein